MNQVLTIDELAAYLQLGRRSVYRLAQSGELPGRKILGRWRFSVREIDAWLARDLNSADERRAEQDLNPADDNARSTEGRHK